MCIELYLNKHLKDLDDFREVEDDLIEFSSLPVIKYDEFALGVYEQFSGDYKNILFITNYGILILQDFIYPDLDVCFQYAEYKNIESINLYIDQNNEGHIFLNLFNKNNIKIPFVNNQNYLQNIFSITKFICDVITDSNFSGKLS